MKDNRLSNTNASHEANSAVTQSLFRSGITDSIDDEEGTVTVRIGPQNHLNCEVLTTTKGDEWYPSLRESVVVAKQIDGTPLIIGTPPSNEGEIAAGERIIGHGASDFHFHFRNDGTVEIIPDGQSSAVLTIDSNGLHFADNSVVTDIDTTTDTDGHVTSVTPIYTTTLSL